MKRRPMRKGIKVKGGGAVAVRATALKEVEEAKEAEARKRGCSKKSRRTHV